MGSETRDVDILGGRYRVGPLLGGGEAAQVYRGYDPVLERDVALKVFAPDVLGEDALCSSQGFRVLEGLRNCGVLVPYDAGVSGTRAYLVLPLFEGATLADRLTQGPLPGAATVALGTSLARTLTHVHASGLAHRDLKPSNVFLNSDDVLIADCGGAELIGHALFSTTESPPETCYLAPEQVSRAGAGPKSDIYSLGLILLECLKGREEYPGTSWRSAIARVHRSPEVPDDLPDELGALLRQMTASNPALRPSAHAVSEVLRSVAIQEAPSTVPQQRGAVTSGLRGFSVGLAAAVSAAVAVLAAGVLALALRPTGHQDAEPHSAPPPTPPAGPPTSQQEPVGGGPPESTGEPVPQYRPFAGDPTSSGAGAPTLAQPAPGSTGTDPVPAESTAPGVSSEPGPTSQAGTKSQPGLAGGVAPENALPEAGPSETALPEAGPPETAPPESAPTESEAHESEAHESEAHESEPHEIGPAPTEIAPSTTPSPESASITPPVPGDSGPAESGSVEPGPVSSPATGSSTSNTSTTERQLQERR